MLFGSTGSCACSASHDTVMTVVRSNNIAVGLKIQLFDWVYDFVSVSSGNLLVYFILMVFKVMRQQQSREYTLLPMMVESRSESGNDWQRESLCGRLFAIAELVYFFSHMILSKHRQRMSGVFVVHHDAVCIMHILSLSRIELYLKIFHALDCFMCT